MYEKFLSARPILIATIISVATLGNPSVVLAEGYGKGQHDQRYAAMKAHHGQHKHMRDKGHGKHKHRGKQGHHLHGTPWNKTLTDEQKVKLDQLGAAHARHAMPMKARAGVIKTELAALATADSPDTQAIGERINALLEIKREILTQKYLYIAAKRSVLTHDQRPSFDMSVMQKAAQPKMHKRRH